MLNSFDALFFLRRLQLENVEWPFLARAEVVLLFLQIEKSYCFADDCVFHNKIFMDLIQQSRSAEYHYREENAG